MITRPVRDTQSDLAKKISSRPRKIGIGENLPISMAMIWLLKVVPILAPSTTPIAWRKVRALAFTSTMAMMITAEEESRISVMTIPVRMAVNTFRVNFASSFFAFSPSRSFNASERLEIAKRNKPSPPRIISIVSIISG